MLGKASKFIYLYYIENSETSARLNSFSGFQKQISQKVNPLLNQFDITQLPTGNYNLVIELKDSLNKLNEFSCDIDELDISELDIEQVVNLSRFKKLYRLINFNSLVKTLTRKNDLPHLSKSRSCQCQEFLNIETEVGL